MRRPTSNVQSRALPKRHVGHSQKRRARSTQAASATHLHIHTHTHTSKSLIFALCSPLGCSVSCLRSRPLVPCMAARYGILQHRMLCCSTGLQHRIPAGLADGCAVRISRTSRPAQVALQSSCSCTPRGSDIIRVHQWTPGDHTRAPGRPCGRPGAPQKRTAAHQLQLPCCQGTDALRRDGNKRPIMWLPKTQG